MADAAHLFQRHQELLRLYAASRRSRSVGSDASSILPRTDQHVSQHDLAILQQNFQFLRDDQADAAQGETDWQVRMSVRYYHQLFREYALADLSRYREGKIGLRWRTETEVVTGRGQFSCGNKQCDARTGLRSYEVLFAYKEQGAHHRCLVKVRACRACAEKLFYKKLTQRKGTNSEATRKRKRRRVGATQQVSRSDSGDNGEEKDIHCVCAQINADETAAYLATAKVDKSAPRGPELVELLI